MKFAVCILAKNYFHAIVASYLDDIYDDRICRLQGKVVATSNKWRFDYIIPYKLPLLDQKFV